MSRPTLTSEFVAGPKGPIFVLLRRPAGPAQGCVLVVPPFAEEMNKCRRMVTEAALGLAEHGIATLVPDLYGTGDSGGDFADGNWNIWQQDLAVSVDWAAKQGSYVNSILAIRLGAALAVTAQGVGAIPAVNRTVLWQPVFDGSRFLTQFLRLRVAASMMEDRKETLAELRGRLKVGEAVEVSGYTLSSRLSADLDAVTVPSALPPSMGAVTWLEVGRDAGSFLSPASARLIEQTCEKSVAVEARVLAGEPFWSSSEIVVHRQIVDATIERLSQSTEWRARI